MQQIEDCFTLYLSEQNLGSLYKKSRYRDSNVFQKELQSIFQALSNDFANQGSVYQSINNTNNDIQSSVDLLNDITLSMLSDANVHAHANVHPEAESFSKVADATIAQIWTEQQYNPKSLYEKREGPQSIMMPKPIVESTEYASADTDNMLLPINHSPPGDEKAVTHTVKQVFDHIPFESRNNVISTRRIPHTYMLDSRDRDSSKYQNPNDYVVDTNFVFRNVTSISLLSCILPNTIYNIYANNNLIHFQETNGVTLVAQVPPGDYDETTLPVAVKAALEVVGNSTYTVTIDPATHKTSITSDLSGGGGIFTILFAGDNIKKGFSGSHVSLRTNSIGSVLGFLPIDLSGVNSYVSQGIVNLNTLPYLLLFIENADKYESTESPKNAFCKIIRSVDGSYSVHTNNTYFNNLKYYSPPMAKLDRLYIKFTDYWGNIIDFNAADHSILLDIETIEDIDRKI